VAGACAIGAAMMMLAPPRVGAEGALHTLPVQGQVHLVAGAGGNITVHAGPMGVLVVDSGGSGTSEQVLAAIRRISARPIHYLVNTSVDADHIGGNGALAKAGRPAPGTGQGLGSDYAAIVAHEHVLNRMTAPSGQKTTIAEDDWPTTTFFTPKKTMSFNEEPIELIWQPAAHSDGDLMVFFRASDVISVGDIVSTLTYPVIDVARGGSIQGEIDALNRIIDLTIPRFNQMGGTRVIPGHGRICNEADIVEYRDMVTIIRDRILALVKDGKTLEQVQAAKPTYEYDPMYGATSGPWTTSQFVEAIYKSLTAKPAAE
jgi:cyclase